MKTNQENVRSRTARVGWGILLGMSVLLTLAGIFWYVALPQMTLDNIAERISMEPAGFMVGEPSAFDVITLVARGYATGYAVLGLLALLVAWEGYRKGTRWAWTASWVLVLAFAALAIDFVLAGGLSGGSVGYLIVAAMAVIGQLLAGTGIAR